MSSENWRDVVSKVQDSRDYNRFFAQLEKGERSERIHVQGFVMFCLKTSLNKCKEIHGTAHWEPAVAGIQSNYAYCTKPDCRVEGTEPILEGEPKDVSGKRSDHDIFVEKVVNAAEYSLTRLIEEHPKDMLHNSRKVDRLRMMIPPPKKMKRWVEVHYGATETGKTHYCWMRPEEPVFKMTEGITGAWWDGYMDEPTVCIDEFYGWIPHSKMCDILDDFATKVEVKGSARWLRANKIYITSNTHPSKWYPNVYAKNPERMKALFRRFDKIYYWPSYGVMEEQSTSPPLGNNDDFEYPEDEPSP